MFSRRSLFPVAERLRIVVNVQRQDFGGPVNFRDENLPAGV